jgi:hypothetical protein
MKKGINVSRLANVFHGISANAPKINQMRRSAQAMDDVDSLLHFTPNKKLLASMKQYDNPYNLYRRPMSRADKFLIGAGAGGAGGALAGKMLEERDASMSQRAKDKNNENRHKESQWEKDVARIAQQFDPRNFMNRDRLGVIEETSIFGIPYTGARTVGTSRSSIFPQFRHKNYIGSGPTGGSSVMKRKEKMAKGINVRGLMSAAENYAGSLTPRLGRNVKRIMNQVANSAEISGMAQRMARMERMGGEVSKYPARALSGFHPLSGKRVRGWKPHDNKAYDGMTNAGYLLENYSSLPKAQQLRLRGELMTWAKSKNPITRATEGAASSIRNLTANASDRTVGRATVAAAIPLAYGLYQQGLPSFERSPRTTSGGSSTKKRLAKSMDMKMEKPTMPSTKRDVRRSSKYFD